MSDRSQKASQKELLTFLAPYAWRTLKENELDCFHNLAMHIWLNRYPLHSITRQQTLKKKLVQDLYWARFSAWNKRNKVGDNWKASLTIAADQRRRFLKWNFACRRGLCLYNYEYEVAVTNENQRRFLGAACKESLRELERQCMEQESLESWVASY